MDAPNFRDPRIYLVHLFRVLLRRGRSKPADIYEEVADLAGLTPEQRAVDSPDTWNPVYRNRIQFARQSLIDAGVVMGSTEPGWRRGTWELTQTGVRLARTQRSDAALESKLRELAAQGV